MYQKYPTRTVGADIEFLAHEKGLETINFMISDEGVEVDDNGDKYVVKGQFIDKDGKVTKPTVSAQDVTFEQPPVGILFATVDVTYGPAHGALMVAGTVKGEWLMGCQDGNEQDYDIKQAEAIVKLLPRIRFLGDDGSYVYNMGGGGAAGAAAASTVDLSKATGTLSIDKGGTGATSASEALSALLESQPLSVENGGTGKTSASEALDALLESQPLPITKGGTGASDKDTAVTNLGAQKAE